METPKTARPPPETERSVAETIVHSYADIEPKIHEFEHKAWKACFWLTGIALLFLLLVFHRIGWFVPIGALLGLGSFHGLIKALTPQPTAGHPSGSKAPPSPVGKALAIILIVVILHRLGANLLEIILGLFLCQIAIIIAALGFPPPPPRKSGKADHAST